MHTKSDCHMTITCTTSCQSFKPTQGLERSPQSRGDRSGAVAIVDCWLWLMIAEKSFSKTIIRQRQWFATANNSYHADKSSETPPTDGDFLEVANGRLTHIDSYSLVPKDSNGRRRFEQSKQTENGKRKTKKYLPDSTHYINDRTITLDSSTNKGLERSPQVWADRREER